MSKTDNGMYNAAAVLVVSQNHNNVSFAKATTDYPEELKAHRDHFKKIQEEKGDEALAKELVSSYGLKGETLEKAESVLTPEMTRKIKTEMNRS